jgi:glycosyltransferase involved in cell wall biosynthesis
MTRVSVVIPCHNYGRSLGAAVESVAAQEDPDWEVVIVDDGSTDSTGSVAEEWQSAHPDRIHCVRQDNAGPGAARNHGARRSSGEWLLFFDADNVLLPGALRRYREAASRHGGASLVVAGAQTLREGIVVDTRNAGQPGDDRIGNFAAFVRGELCPFNGGAVMLHRRVVERLAYPENIRTSEDFVFFAQAFSLFDCASAHAPAVAMHRHRGSLRYNRTALDSARDVMIDLLFNPEVLPERAMAYRNEVESTWCLVVSRAFYLHGDYPQAARYYRRGIRLYPRNLRRTSYLGKFLVSALRSSLPGST